MREQLLAQMEAARSDSAAVLPPEDFQYNAIAVRRPASRLPKGISLHWLPTMMHATLGVADEYGSQACLCGTRAQGWLNVSMPREQGELVVAGVFVRIYNEQPAYAVADPAAFAKGLVSWIHASAGATLGPEAQRQGSIRGEILRVTIFTPGHNSFAWKFRKQLQSDLAAAMIGEKEGMQASKVDWHRQK